MSCFSPPSRTSPDDSPYGPHISLEGRYGRMRTQRKRTDFGAFGETAVCTSYYNIEKLFSEKGGPVGGNPERFAAKADDPVRKIVAELC